MEDVLVGEELDVADFEDHVEGFTEADGFEDVGGFELRRGEGRDEARRAKAREGADVVGVPSGDGRVSGGVGWFGGGRGDGGRGGGGGVLGVNAALAIGLEVED